MDGLKKKAARLLLKLAAFIYRKLPELWQQKIKTAAAFFAAGKLEKITLQKMNDLELMERKLKQLSEEEAAAYGMDEPGEDPAQDQPPGEDQAGPDDVSEMMDSAEFVEIINKIESMALKPLFNKYPKISEKITDDSITLHSVMTAKYIKLKTGGRMDFETAYLSYTGFMAVSILGVIAEDKIKQRKAAKRTGKKENER